MFDTGDSWDLKCDFFVIKIVAGTKYVFIILIRIIRHRELLYFEIVYAALFSDTLNYHTLS